MNWPQRVLLALLLGAAIAYLPQGIPDYQSSEDLAVIEQEYHQLVTTNQQLKHEIHKLQAEVHAIKHDPLEIERIARRDLNLVRPDQLVFAIVGEKQ